MEDIDNLDVYKAQELIRVYLNSIYVKKPDIPKLKSITPTREDVILYNQSLKQHEIDLAEFEIKNKFYKSEDIRLYNLLYEKIKEDSGLNAIPEQYRDKVYSYAYSEGHSGGYSEVYNYLLDLVEIFN